MADDDGDYEVMYPAGSDHIKVKKNESYGEVKEPANNNIPIENDYVYVKEGHREAKVPPRKILTFRVLVEKIGSNRKVIVLILAFTTVALLLGAVAAGTGYAISKLNLQLNIASKQMNGSIEILKQQLVLEVQKLQSTSNSTTNRVETLEEVAEMNTTIRVYQQLIRDMMSFRSELQQLQASTDEHNENATQQYDTLGFKISQVQAFSNQQYTTLDTKLQQLQNLTSEQYENATQQLNDRIVQIEASSSLQYSTLDSRVDAKLQRLQNLTAEQYENSTQQLNDRIMQVEASSNQQYSTLNSRIGQVQTSSSQQYSTLDSRITGLQQLQNSTAEQHENVTLQLNDRIIQIKASSSQQFTSLNSMWSARLQQLQNLTAEQYENVTIQLDYRIMQIQDSSNQHYSALDSRINTGLQQLQNSTTEQYENVTWDLNQIEALSNQQYFALNSSIDQVQNFSSQQYLTINIRLQQLQNLTVEQYENMTRNVDEKIMQIEDLRNQQYSALNSSIDLTQTSSDQQFLRITTVLQQLQNSTAEQFENATLYLESRINQVQTSISQQNFTLNSRINEVETSSNQQYVTLNSRINQVQHSSQTDTQQTTALIEILQQQSAQNDSSLDDSIEIIESQIRELNDTLRGCGGQGWKVVGYLDMTDPSQSCPSGLALKYYSPGLRSCGRATNDSEGCWSTFFSTGTSQYSRVCGRIRGYQFGATDSFLFRSHGINSYYVEGISLTHGQSNRSHIWTFAAGLTESSSGNFGLSQCPCTSSSAIQPPTFVGNDYFCESGFHDVWIPSAHARQFFNDPLWDGQNCIDNCCQFNNPPYFIKNLPTPTTDDIELRICINDPAIYGDTPIDQLELYVQP